MQSSRFLALVAALLFIAVCAYIFCGVYSAVDAVELARVRRLTVNESARLTGVAIRTEQLLTSAAYVALAVPDGERQEKGAVLAQNGEGQLLSPCSAVCYTQADGLEYLSPSACAQLTPDSLQKLLDARPAPVGSALGRLVTDCVWYYAAFMEASSPPPEPGRCTVLFDGLDGAYPARLVSVSPAQGGRRALLLRLSAGGDCLRLRFCQGELIFARHTGLALPVSALRHDEEGDYVYTASAGLARRKSVEIEYVSGELCIVRDSAGADGLSQGELVVSGEDIYEGCVIA